MQELGYLEWVQLSQAIDKRVEELHGTIMKLDNGKNDTDNEYLHYLKETLEHAQAAQRKVNGSRP